MDIIKVESSKVPKRHFVKISLKEGKRELHFLPGQYLPTSTSSEGELTVSKEGWKATIINPEVKASNDEEYYEVSKPVATPTKSEVFVICKDKEVFNKITKESAEETIEKYSEVILKEDKPEEVDGPEKSETSEKPTKSIIPEEGLSEEEVAKLPYLEALMYTHKLPTLEKDKFSVSEKLWRDMVRDVDKRKNILIKGDSGIGKTEIVELIGKTFDLPVKKYDFGLMQDPIPGLVGTHRLKAKESYFDAAQFIKDVQTPCIMLMDEVNRAALEALNIIMPLSDNTKQINLSIASSDVDQIVKRHPDCIFIATANIGNNFVGTIPIDTAVEERFLFIEMEYPSEKGEINTLVEKKGISKTDAKKIVKIAEKIRGKYHSDTIGKNLSVRGTLEVAEFVADGYTIVEGIEKTMKAKMDEDYAEVADILHSH